MLLFDSHAHYDDARFDGDRRALLDSLPGKGVGRVINAGTNIDSSKASAALAEAFPFIYAAAGVHPHEAGDMDEATIACIKMLCGYKKTVAVGEIGLDYYYDNSPRELQRRWFAEQLQLAADLNLPVIVHSRDAAADTFNIIKDSGARKGVIHCFSGSVETALEYVKLGFYIGIGGAVTFDKTRRLPEVAARVPLERVLIETDAPYQTPKPHRGKRNDSSYLTYVVEAIAQIRNAAPETVAGAAYENGERLFLRGGSFTAMPLRA